jgi:hypothetical protein
MFQIQIFKVGTVWTAKATAEKLYGKSYLTLLLNFVKFKDPMRPFQQARNYLKAKGFWDQLTLGNEKPEVPFQDIIHPIKTECICSQETCQNSSCGEQVSTGCCPIGQFSDKRLGSDKWQVTMRTFAVGSFLVHHFGTKHVSLSIKR